MARFGRLARVVEIFKAWPIGKVNRTRLAFGHKRPIFANNLHNTQHRFANRSGVLKPFFGVHHGEAIAFGTRIVFVKNRPPPVDHRLLDCDGTGRSGVDRNL